MLATSQETETNTTYFIHVVKLSWGDMFRPGLGHLQALVKIQILELSLKMQYGIPIAYNTCVIKSE